jgi:hypothetical protein
MSTFECLHSSPCMLLCDWRQHLVYCWQITSEQTGTNQNYLHFWQVGYLKTAILKKNSFGCSQRTRCSSSNYVQIWYGADKKAPKKRNYAKQYLFLDRLFRCFSSSVLFCILSFRPVTVLLLNCMSAFDIAPLNTHKKPERVNNPCLLQTFLSCVWQQQICWVADLIKLLTVVVNYQPISPFASGTFTFA